MKILLLSGGAGSRLWPISNEVRSKQFLKVLKNEEGHYESMVQRICKQLKRSDLLDNTYILTPKSQVDVLKNQIGESLRIIIEPERRDTFPAISLAVTYLNSVEKLNPKEVICVLPVDSYVEDEYFQKIKQLESLILMNKGDLALIGKHPTYPYEKFGYILSDKENKVNQSIEFRQVKRFVEKPQQEEAEKLIKGFALWNCGVFAFKLEYMLNELSSRKWPVEYEQFYKQFNKLPKISFDYEVVEKCNKSVVIPYSGLWKDLGTWDELTGYLDTNQLGDSIRLEESDNTHIINELSIPVTVIGLSNTLIACSSDGILVLNKSESHNVKQYTQDIKGRPMYEERRWGSYRVLHYEKNKAIGEVLTKKLIIDAGKNISYQLHHKRDEIWLIISGEGKLAIDDNIITVKPGDMFRIPAGTKHGVRAITDLEILETQTGTELIEEDIIRILMTWEEIESQLSEQKSNTKGLEE